MNPEVRRAAEILRAGGLVAFPTETVYGLGADASSAAAIARLYAAKGRPADHPVIVHFATAEAAFAFAREIPPGARKLAERFWPGPLTLVLKRSPKAQDFVTGVRLGFGTFQVVYSLLKATLFGAAIAFVCSYEGFVTEAGAEGVGRSTAKAVVITSVTILILDTLTAALLAPYLQT